MWTDFQHPFTVEFSIKFCAQAHLYIYLCSIELESNYNALKYDIYFLFFSETPDLERTTVLSRMQNLVVQFGKEQRTLWGSGLLCGWEGNRRSGYASQTLCGISSYRLHRLKERLYHRSHVT